MKPAADPRQEWVERIEALLPQTQCTRCGEPDCRGYAQAIADGAPINRCPPGGVEGIERLAALTGRSVAPLDPVHGLEGPRLRVWIDESTCIGCTLCIKACPVDAIVGAPKRMHDVVESWCTGCELCIPACPVDCIHREVATPGRVGWQAWSPAQADQAHGRYRRHAERVAREAEREARRLAARALRPPVATTPPPAEVETGLPATPAAPDSVAPPDAEASKRATIDAAMARARALRGG